MSDREARVGEAVAWYFQTTEAGIRPDRADFLARFPDLRPELESFLADKGAFDQAAGPPAPAPPDPDDTVPPSANNDTATLPPATADWNATTPRANSNPALAPGMSLASIRNFGDYELLSEIARGGMGVVFRARQVSLNREVALKMILTGQLAGPADVIRFRAEAEAAANLDHPNVLPIYEVGEHQGQQYFAMKLVPGGSLAGKVATWVHDPKAAVGVFVKVCRAVEFAHKRGILHRDLKPGNILLDRDGTPFVTDFGLAKKVDADSNLTQSGAIVGTPSYMPPEQARAEKQLTTAADVYALGAILYELLTGRPPFRGPTVLDTILQVLEKDAADPRAVNPGADRDLSVIALKCLEKNPTKRYESAGALADDLDRWTRGEPILAREVTRSERAAKWVRRNKKLAALLAALVAVTAIGFAGVTVGFLRAEHRGRELAAANDELGQTLTDLEASRTDLARAEGDANRRAAEAEYQGYLSDVALAYQYWKANDLRSMRDTLARCPAPLRKWEWRYLDGLARPFEEEITANEIPVDVAYSPDGTLLAWVGHNGQVVVRDRAAGTDKFRVPPRRTGGLALAFRRDGKELAYVDSHGLGVLDLTTGKTRTITDPVKTDIVFGKEFERDVAYRPVAVAFAPDGRLLVAGLWDRERARADGPRVVNRIIAVRDVTAGKAVGMFVAVEDVSGVPLTCGSVAFSPDGRRLAAVVNVLPGHAAAVRADGTAPSPEEAKKGPDARAAAEAASRPHTAVWDIASGKLLRRVPAAGSSLRQVAFNGTGSRVAVGDDRRAIVFDPMSTDPPDVRDHHTAGVLGVAFGPDGVLWTGAEDRRVCGSVPGTPYPRTERRGCPNPVLRLTVSPDGSEAVAVSFDAVSDTGRLHRFETSGSRDAWRFGGGERIGAVVAVSPDGTKVAAVDGQLGGDDVRFMIRDTRTGSEHRAEKPGPWLRGVFRPDGGLVVLDARSERRETLQVLGADARRVRELPLPADGPGFTSPALDCSADGTVVVGALGLSGGIPEPDWVRKVEVPRLRLATWDVVSGRPGQSIDLDLTPLLSAGMEADVLPLGCAVSADGRRAAATAVLIIRGPEPAAVRLQGLVAAWDRPTGAEVLRRVSDEPVRFVGFDPAGRLVTAGGSATTGGELACWDLATRTEVFRIRGHARAILAATFGPDGRIVTAGADRVVKVWDAASGREILTLDEFAREVTQVRFTSDGRDLVAGTGFDPVPWMLTPNAAREQVFAPGEVRVFRGGR